LLDARLLYIKLILNIYKGIDEPSSVNPDASLGDLGIDSLMSAEVKNTLKRGFDIAMGTKEIRELTIYKLQSIANSLAA
jgi:fatty acid synthase